MKIIDLQRILYPMSVCLQTVKEDYFYFGYSSDLAISIQKITDENWELNTYERDEITDQEFYSSEYIACLKLLYHIDKISSDDPTKTKLLDYSENWELFEKNKKFHFLIQLSRPYLYRNFAIILTTDELEKYRLNGRNYLNLLQSEIDLSFPIKISSKYHNRKVSTNLEKELNDTSFSEYELRTNYEETAINYSDSIKNIPKSSSNSTSPLPNISVFTIIILFCIFLIFVFNI